MRNGTPSVGLNCCLRETHTNIGLLAEPTTRTMNEMRKRLGVTFMLPAWCGSAFAIQRRHGILAGEILKLDAGGCARS